MSWFDDMKPMATKKQEILTYDQWVNKQRLEEWNRRLREIDEAKKRDKVKREAKK